MRKVTAQEADQIRSLELRLGSLRFRTLMTSESRRLMRPERLSRLSGGSGKLSDDEAARLSLIRRNSNKLRNLGKKETIREKKGGKRKDFEVNRKLRDWLTHGKEKGIRVDDWKSSDDEWYDALDALDYFDIDPDAGTYYVEKE